MMNFSMNLEEVFVAYFIWACSPAEWAKLDKNERLLDFTET
jgi:hypothetical protein